MLQYGYPKDEYINTGHFTTQMYVREARRMIGEYVMTQANCQGKETVNDCIALAAYTMDSHNAERLIENSMVKNEGDVQVGGFGPYPISYRSLTPKRTECNNLLVPVCLSASHIAYGSIRMEPVFMMLGQSAAVAAVMAINGHMAVQQINDKKLRSELKQNPLADRSTPEILVDNDDENGVIIHGNWKRMANFEGCYGPSLLMNDRPEPGDYVRYTPGISRPGDYNVYLYVVKTADYSPGINILINDGKKEKNITIKMADINIKGQTVGEWISLGHYVFSKGNKGSVTISRKNADGIIMADAVLFVPHRK
jgi:hypothetical protein